MGERRALAALALLLALGSIAGCGGGGEDDPGRVIREWSRATNAGDYDRAGALFAPNALVEQVDEMRLRGSADAARFSASLPCKADVTRVEAGRRTSLAIFRLRAGRTPCSGEAEVRFAVRDGRLTEWRQLGPAPPPRGLQTSLPADA